MMNQESKDNRLADNPDWHNELKRELDRLDGVIQTMPFGQYKGKPIDSIPTHYLSWVLKKCRNLDATLVASIRAVLKTNHR